MRRYPDHPWYGEPRRGFQRCVRRPQGLPPKTAQSVQVVPPLKTAARLECATLRQKQATIWSAHKQYCKMYVMDMLAKVRHNVFVSGSDILILPSFVKIVKSNYQFWRKEAYFVYIPRWFLSTLLTVCMTVLVLAAQAIFHDYDRRLEVLTTTPKSDPMRGFR